MWPVWCLRVCARVGGDGIDLPALASITLGSKVFMGEGKTKLVMKSRLC